MSSKEYYEINGWIKFADEDRFNEGCTGDAVQFCGKDVFKGTHPNSVIAKFCDFVGAEKSNVELNSCDESGRVDICVMENGDGYPASKREIELWKSGDVRLWYAVYTGYVDRVHRESEDLAGVVV